MRKYIILLCDGMADLPNEVLDGKTPMMLANKPTIDALAAKAEIGMVQTVPAGMSPGSDVANLSVLGYNPTDCYTGRSPLEAANIGVNLAEDDLAFRCNLVTLSDEANYADKSMADYCAGDIHTGEADEIVKTLQAAFGNESFSFHTGTAYRHCLVWHGQTADIGKLTPPHDISGQVIGDYLPACAPLLDMMQKSVDLLKDHPVNVARRAKGLNPANAIWLWGQGSRPRLQNFEERFGVRGAMISAVDLLKGIAKLGGMPVYEVEGATGYIDTNFEGKQKAAVQALKDGADVVYIHVEAPDECGHRGEHQNKVRAIEEIDRRLLKPLLDELQEMGDFSILILPDHPTPLSTRTHSSEPVPYLLYRSYDEKAGVPCFTEEAAKAVGTAVRPVGSMMNRLLEKD